MCVCTSICTFELLVPDVGGDDKLNYPQKGFFTHGGEVYISYASAIRVGVRVYTQVRLYVCARGNLYGNVYLCVCVSENLCVCASANSCARSGRVHRRRAAYGWL